MHDGHQHHVDRFRRLFWLSLLLAVPTVALSSSFAHLLGYAVPDLPGSTWVAPIGGTVIYLVGGRPFLSGGWSELRSREPGMMLLIAMAISVAFVSSWAAALGLVADALAIWWELALLVVVMLLGHWLEMRSLARTASALDSLAELLPDEVERLRDGDSSQTETVSPADLAVGDVVVVRPGGTVPADGSIVEGEAAVDESMITGESRPVRRGGGDRVVAGTIATDSGIRVEIEALGDDTALAGIQQLVEQAQSAPSRTQRLADRAAAGLFWYALAAAVVTALAWLLLADTQSAVERTITVLVIACPHALGLAIPLVISLATGRAAERGVLIKDRTQLEAVRRLDTVVFDKTGTLTRGEPRVVHVAAVADLDEDRLMAVAAAAERDSEHPLARAIAREAQDRGIEVPEAADFSSSPAVGVTATVDGAGVRVGGPALLDEADLEAVDGTVDWADDGSTVLHVVRDGEVVGALGVADAVRESSRQVVDQLHARDIEVVMITGDAERVAASVADELGIDRYLAEVRPEDKAARIEDLQGEGRTVAMVGDGVNDAPALATADVGLAIGAGTDVAIGSAGIVLASDDPRGVLTALTISEAVRRKSMQNLAWAAGYNVLSVPIAAGALAWAGVVLPMSVGAAMMSASTVIVAANAQLLRRVDLSFTDEPEEQDGTEAAPASQQKEHAHVGS